MNNLSNLEDQIEKELSELQQIQNLLSRFSKEKPGDENFEGILKETKIENNNNLQNLDMSISSCKDSTPTTPPKMISKPLKKRTCKKRKSTVNKKEKSRRKKRRTHQNQKTPKIERNQVEGYFKGIPNNTMKRAKRRGKNNENVAPFNEGKSIKKRRRKQQNMDFGNLHKMDKKQEMVDPVELKNKKIKRSERSRSRVRKRSKSRSTRMVTPSK